jgi:hypothetical protein
MPRPTGATGVYPGSFDPLTVAHVAIADAAVARFGLERLDLVLSERALGKEQQGQAPVAERAAAIERVAAAGRPWLRARVTALALISDIAEGYDVCVVGADKWHQLQEPAFYGGSEAARDAALARLPVLAVAPRAGVGLPAGHGAVLLELAEGHQEVSSSAVRDGRTDWLA